MNSFERKLQTRLRMHPKLLRSLLLNPCKRTLEVFEEANFFESSNLYLAGWINSVLNAWEIHACEGNESLAALINRLETVRISPVKEEDIHIRANLLRQRILASTPGVFPFNPIVIQESLMEFLTEADSLADLPQFAVIYFDKQELLPLRNDFERHSISPLSARYIKNLFHSERQEAILSVLAHIAKNYPLVHVCRQAYALMLSLDCESSWANHPFCLRLIYNHFWELCLEEETG